MADAELLVSPDSCFAAHLDAAHSVGLPETARTAALTMALRNLAANTTNEGEARTVCEQAVGVVLGGDVGGADTGASALGGVGEGGGAGDDDGPVQAGRASADHQGAGEGIGGRGPIGCVILR
jgi:hypothetical protein